MMRRVLLTAFGFGALAGGANHTALAASEQGAAANPHQQVADGTQGVVEKNWAMLEKYCVECHNFTDWAGGVAFDSMTPDEIPQEAKVWESAVRKLRGRLMPPPGEPQPDAAAVESMVSWLETSLDAAAAKHPSPGHVTLHRLNRTEYGLAVEELLGVKVDAANLLPKDIKLDGFDNVASVLKVSPSFLDQYISAAREVSVQAIGNPRAPQTSKTYRAPPFDQSVHIAGLPLGSRGGMLVEHYFPADGEYVLNINMGAGGGYVFGLDHRHKVIMTVDGVKVFEAELGGDEDLKAADQRQQEFAKELRQRFSNIRAQVKAGAHKVGIAFVARSLAESDADLAPLGQGGMERIPRVGGLEVVGPFNPSGVSETASRKRIFVCYPANQGEELPCATQIVTHLTRQAFRRPVTETDTAAPLRFYQAGHRNGGFEAGIQNALTAILSSPKFLYRVEAAPADARPGRIFALGDLELASRLSFFLWSQGPDEELLKIAEAGRLRDPQVMEQQVRRMLADPKSRTLVTNFADQWLTIDEIDDIEPDPALFPEFDEDLRAAFRQEIEMFVDSVLRGDRSVMDLLTADYTFVNERLALHYGIQNVRGAQFRQIRLADSTRWGLLGKGGVLLGTSYGNRTSPVLRGIWVLENITGTPPGAPPPGVETLKENVAGIKAATVRERLQAHRENPSCGSCHGVIDPLGIALENFDAIGRWRVRDREALTAIDASGQLADGTPVNGVDALRAALVSQPEQFVRVFTQKLMIYALGRAVEHHDMPTIRKIVRDAARDDYRLASVVMGIVNSDQFRMKQVPAEESPGTKGNAPVTARLTAQAE